MNRFLKKEWEDTEIPQSAYLQARNRAWARLYPQARPVGRNMIWTAAAAAAMAALAIFWFSASSNLAPDSVPVQAARLENVKSPVAPDLAAPTKVRDGRPTVSKARVGVKRSMAKSRKPSLQAPPSERPDRLVLNFVLPESGVRMIWILDKDFQFNGEIE